MDRSEERMNARRRERMRRRERERRRGDDRHRMMAASLCATGALACTLTGGMPADAMTGTPDGTPIGMPVGTVRGTVYGMTEDTVSDTGCKAMMAWPVERPAVSSPFDEPEQKWLAGHRGIDLEAGTGTELTAPADGTVSFAGKVGGKSVVSLIHGNGMTSSFEPATTDLNVGASVRRGEPFARSDGKSDHCDGVCVHWGVRRAKDDYLDPQRLVSRRRIALKPVE